MLSIIRTTASAVFHSSTMPTFVVTLEKENNKLKTVCPVARSDLDCPGVANNPRSLSSTWPPFHLLQD